MQSIWKLPNLVCRQWLLAVSRGKRTVAVRYLVCQLLGDVKIKQFTNKGNASHRGLSPQGLGRQLLMKFRMKYVYFLPEPPKVTVTPTLREVTASISSPRPADVSFYLLQGFIFLLPVVLLWPIFAVWSFFFYFQAGEILKILDHHGMGPDHPKERLATNA